jgi:hypothetical protein
VGFVSPGVAVLSVQWDAPGGIASHAMGRAAYLTGPNLPKRSKSSSVLTV